MNNLPTYRIQVSLDDEGTFMNAISLVDSPAVEVGFLCFDEQHPMKFKADEYKKCVTGCAIWADKPIYRRDDDGYEYYVVFDKDTIRTIAERYSKDGLWNSVNLQHDDSRYVNSVIMLETFIKDTERGINPAGFEEVSDGSLFVTFKIEDEGLWEECLNGNALNGFSIEIWADMVPADFRNEEPDVEPDDDFEKWLDGIFQDVKKNFVSESAIDAAIDRNVMAEIVVDGKPQTVQVLELGQLNGRSVAVVWWDNGNKSQWEVLNLSDITECTVTDVKAQDWEPLFEKPSYSIIKDILDEVVVPKTAITRAASIPEYISQRRWVMINYDDEQPNPHTAARQCMVVAHGLTKRGNECIRVYERFGDSRSAASGDGEIPDYRLMLTKRIRSIRVPDFMEPWTPDMLDSRYNWNGDRSMSTVFEWYH